LGRFSLAGAEAVCAGLYRVGLHKGVYQPHIKLRFHLLTIGVAANNF